MDIARELRETRGRAGLSQRALAARAGTSQAAVAMYETGRKRPSVATLERLLDAMGATLRIEPRPAATGGPDPEVAGRRLADVLALAESLPHRPTRALRYPRIPSPG